MNTSRYTILTCVAAVLFLYALTSTCSAADTLVAEFSEESVQSPFKKFSSGKERRQNRSETRPQEPAPESQPRKSFAAPTRRDFVQEEQRRPARATEAPQPHMPSQQEGMNTRWRKNDRRDVEVGQPQTNRQQEEKGSDWRKNGRKEKGAFGPKWQTAEDIRPQRVDRMPDSPDRGNQSPGSAESLRPSKEVMQLQPSKDFTQFQPSKEVMQLQPSKEVMQLQPETSAPPHNFGPDRSRGHDEFGKNRHPTSRHETDRSGRSREHGSDDDRRKYDDRRPSGSGHTSGYDRDRHRYDDNRHRGYRDHGYGSGYRHSSPRPHTTYVAKHVIHHLPPRHSVIVHGHDSYHYHSGRYYRPYSSGFILVRPPIGLIVLSLPLGCRTVFSAGVTYSVFGDVYYRPVSSGYQVVEPVRVVESGRPDRVSVIIDLLNVRYGPDDDEAVIAQVNRYAILKVLGSAPGWLYVEVPGEDIRGWVMEEYVAANLGRG